MSATIAFARQALGNCLTLICVTCTRVPNPLPRHPLPPSYTHTNTHANRYLAGTLKRMRLVRLDAGGNSPGRGGCAALGDLLRESSSLQSLGLENCTINRSLVSHDLSVLVQAIKDAAWLGADGGVGVGVGGGGAPLPSEQTGVGGGNPGLSHEGSVVAGQDSFGVSGSEARLDTGGWANLRELSLRGNSCAGAHQVPQSESLGRLLQCLPRLRKLDLSCCLLNDADAAYLGPGLEYVSGSLETLDLSWNALTATGVASLSRALTARTLRTLDVGDNPALGDNGCEVFAQNILRAGAGALGLESLGLRRVGMTDKGLGAVVDALATAHTLRRLDASRNLITCVGACCVADAVAAGHDECFSRVSCMGCVTRVCVWMPAHTCTWHAYKRALTHAGVRACVHRWACGLARSEPWEPSECGPVRQCRSHGGQSTAEPNRSYAVGSCQLGGVAGEGEVRVAR